ncbi:sigma-54-dependent Fis family transcriptional regulator [Beijerinckia mobilis]|uniref:sigma-54-dependent Fis family transcriptional regulator n=1 Tax=Beijerinckia mobilis TaxID=231434 RepID=UPI000A04C2A4|nr:sigma-54-dependent Fis family transcriptional regulator [Beijerinckia mobilis]
MHIDQPDAKKLSHQSLVAFDANVERLTTKAWEDYRSGIVRCPQVRDVVAKSWERCVAIGINPNRPGSETIIEEAEFEKRLHRNTILLNAAKVVLEEVHFLLANDSSMLVLTDVTGIVLCAVGNAETVERGQEINLVVGADWSEAKAGTNGIGTTLAYHNPVLIHASEHFCSLTKNWTCVGCPVRNPLTGEILGLVDISGQKSTYQRHNLAFIVMVARRIEEALKLQFEIEHRHLVEYSSKYSKSSDGDGLIILNRFGRILRADERASRLLATRSGYAELLGTSPTESAAFLELSPDGRSFDLTDVRKQGIEADNVIQVQHEGALIGAIVITPSNSPRPALSQKQSKAFEPIATGCASMADVIYRAKRLAAYHAPVLIEGETGVGKELFARAIHDASPCAHGPFVTFNCGAVSRELIATELFGYVKGAFTGALSTGTLGRFERAHNGTLCLDEIGELPLDLQPYLLRVLEEQAVYRVGDATPRPIKVRLIAMTNRDLAAEVEAGRFRRDLLYRLNVSTLKVPPLRRRPGDAVLLAKHFLATLTKKHELGSRHFTPDVLDIFQTYAWPGNIRELRNIVESALLLCDTTTIGRSWLSPSLLDHYQQYNRPEPNSIPENASDREIGRVEPKPSKDELKDLRSHDKIYIENVLDQFRGNISHAANALGIARSTLYRRLQTYGLDVTHNEKHVHTSKATHSKKQKG